MPRKFVIGEKEVQLINAFVKFDKRKTALLISVRDDLLIIGATDGLWVYAQKLDGQYVNAVFTTKDLEGVSSGSVVWTEGSRTRFAGRTERVVDAPKAEFDINYVRSLFNVDNSLPISPSLYDVIKLKNVYGRSLLSGASVVVLVTYTQDHSLRYDLYTMSETVTRLSLQRWSDVTDLLMMKRRGVKGIYVGVGWLFKRWLRFLASLAPRGCWAGYYFDGTEVEFNGEKFPVAGALVAKFYRGRSPWAVLAIAGLRIREDVLRAILNFRQPFGNFPIENWWGGGEKW